MEFNVRIFQSAPKVPLGEMIAECDIRNSANQYSIDNLKGISIEKKFIETKAKMDGVSLLPYKIVKPEWMAFDRLARFNSWGSARETFTFSDLQRYEIPLPSIDVQKQYVNAYRSLQKLAEQNEALAAPLKNACMSFMAHLRNKYDLQNLGKYITQSNEKNSSLEYGVNHLQGQVTVFLIILRQKQKG